MVEALKIVALCTGGAVAYGLVHDQVTVRICLEYFSIFHPPLAGTEDPTLLALFWGVVATWWAGLLVGVPLAAAARAGSRPKRAARDLLRPVGVLLLCMAAAAALAGVAGRVLASQGLVRVHPDWARRIPEAEHLDFLTALWIHNGSYWGGFVGGVVLAVRTWRGRGGRAAEGPGPGG
jgi:hypothetical protein